MQGRQSICGSCMPQCVEMYSVPSPSLGWTMLWSAINVCHGSGGKNSGLSYFCREISRISNMRNLFLSCLDCHYLGKMSANSPRRGLKIVNQNGKWPGNHEKGQCLWKEKLVEEAVYTIHFTEIKETEKNGLIKADSFNMLFQKSPKYMP